MADSILSTSSQYNAPDGDIDYGDGDEMANIDQIRAEKGKKLKEARQRRMERAVGTTINPTTVRFTDDDLLMLYKLADHFGEKFFLGKPLSMAELLRLALRRLADEEGVTL